MKGCENPTKYIRTFPKTRKVAWKVANIWKQITKYIRRKPVTRAVQQHKNDTLQVTSIEKQASRPPAVSNNIIIGNYFPERPGTSWWGTSLVPLVFHGKTRSVLFGGNPVICRGVPEELLVWTVSEFRTNSCRIASGSQFASVGWWNCYIIARAYEGIPLDKSRKAA